MNTFYFNTGVKPTIFECGKLHHIGLYGNEVWRGGVIQIPFECDAPKDAVFMFACDHADMHQSENENVIVCKIKKPNKCMLSKYAYFRTK